jgi:hypothetical protein
LEAGFISTKKSPFGCIELSQEIQAIGRDVEGTNTYNEFIPISVIIGIQNLLP